MKYYIELSDKRNTVVKNLLSNKGEDVEEFLWEKVDEIQRQDICVFSPAKKFQREDLEKFPQGISLVCGNLSDENLTIIKSKEIKHINLMSDEEFTIKNANLTAEGVLAIMLEKSPRSMFENNVLILGGGRIARALAVLFGKLGVKFAIVSYNEVKFPTYYIYTDKCYFKDSFKHDLKEYDIIVNTIPDLFFNEELVSMVEKDTLFIETASVKCLDESLVKNFEYVLAPALPQRFSHETAGKLVLERILKG